MFNLKDLHQLQTQAKEIKKKMENEVVGAESHGIKIKMNGNQEVLDVEINPELSKEDQEKYLKEVINEAIKKIQQLMAHQMMGQ